MISLKESFIGTSPEIQNIKINQHKLTQFLRSEHTEIFQIILWKRQLVVRLRKLKVQHAK